ncbi:MAG: hypothetical protein AAGD07_08410 [Planctomycetota bacterium]
MADTASIAGQLPMEVNATPRPKTSGQENNRVSSIDVFRGLVMVLMLFEVMHLQDLSSAFPGLVPLRWLLFHTSHVAWEGCSLHDLIQPGFTFLVGTAMAFSIAARWRRGERKKGLLLHAIWRGLILVVLGILLRSLGPGRINVTFEDTLTQIGLGYPIVFAVALLPKRFAWMALGMVLVGYWALFALSPAPPVTFDYAAVGVPDDWPHHHDGFASRWNKNSHVAWRFDVWILNGFPREHAFEYNAGGYATLSFIPTMGTMFFGLIAGIWMRDLKSAADRFRRLIAVGAIAIGLGVVLAWTDVCPLVKRVWTPSFALFSSGICLWFLVLLHWVCDLRGRDAWAKPFLVVGANSILIYVLNGVIANPMRKAIEIACSPILQSTLRPEVVRVVSGAMTLCVLYLLMRGLYQRRWFIRI